MKQNKGRKLMSVLLALAMVVGLLPGMSLTAYAETPAGFVALNENFDEGLGSSWWVNTQSTAYRFEAKDGYVYAAPAKENDGNETYCYSPVMDLSEAVSATLVFKYKNPTKGTAPNRSCDDFFVDYVVDNDSATQVFADDNFSNNHDDWQTKTITLPTGALKTNVQIRFRAKNWTALGVYFDDVAVYYTKSIVAVSNDVVIPYDAQAHGVTVSVTEPSSGAKVMYGTVEGTYDKTASPNITNVADSPMTVYYKITADNYADKTGSATVTITPVDPTTPTGLTATYGQTLADVTLPDGWAWKDSTTSVGSVGTNSFKANYTATSTNYNNKSDVDVSVIVGKANAVPATVTVNNRTYDGTEKPLVNVDNSTLVGGEMRYALGENATTAPAENLYTTSIPTAINAGTYYVWYKVVGDANHTDTTPACVTATIDAPRPSSSGGGGSSVASYDIVVADGITGGSVKPDRTNVGVGTRVTVTVTPDPGYKLDKLTATDKNDKDVALTQGDNGTYTFTMPNSKVTLSATFVSDGSQPTPTPPTPSDSEKFVDVPKDAWYHDAVYWAVDKGITEGVDATHFAPDATCTRAQMVTFLWRAAGEPVPANNVNPFTDVDGDAYYYNAVLWGVDQGIVKGTSETTFSPNATVTRAQTVAFLYRYEQSQGGGFTGTWAFPLNYSDAADVPDWAYEPFCWMTMHEVVQGSDGKLLPNDKCLRSQIVTMLDRYFNSAEV